MSKYRDAEFIESIHQQAVHRFFIDAGVLAEFTDGYEFSTFLFKEVPDVTKQFSRGSPLSASDIFDILRVDYSSSWFTVYHWNEIGF